MTPEEFETMVADASRMVGQNKFDEAISLCKEALKFEACDEEPFARIWPAGTIVAAYAFKHKDNEPDPGTDAYEDLKKYTKITLDAFDNLDVDQQEHYKNSNQLFHMLRPLLEITQAGKPLSDLNAPPPKKSGCFVATEIYGSYNDSNVLVLRSYRDNVLLPSQLGKFLVNVYYTVSPSIAIFLSKVPVLKKLIRKFVLQPFVDHLSSNNQ
ncbi:CFI-box-CTERM domain-containing protein [Desulfotignum phosphitoxidans]|uniref:Uncharacterized protein n=1 Tax=Desulfotignum phosphitoxidans DSM 13687 TaxID=1286635 RepID=S0G837_9BACT|nr:CFI-box-CTERM domain-containing protein [Desulfotignum phosphitoxidans]EMS81446.1 hypothetical protein Dpo_1c05870 [Desulfotignum phosphitoxidans DSM 13687]